MLIAGACSADSGEEVRADVPATSAPAAVTPVAATALWAFTADLFRAVGEDQPDTNAVLAPVPIALGLAQAAAGARGTTRDQLDDVLHAGQGFDQGLGTVWSELPDRSGRRENDATGRTGRISIELASSLWAQRNTPFEDPWLDTLARTWDAGIRETDFRSDPEQARRTVNEWVTEATNDQITQLLSRGELDALTRFLATSATYLKAPWSAPFAPSATRVTEFRRLDGSEVTVPMMQRVDARVGWAEGAGWQAVTLGYLGGELDLTIVLPDEERFAAVERAHDGAALVALLESARTEVVDVSLPRFGFTTDLELTDPLRTLGATDAFDPLLADFTGVSAEEPLSLSGVAHQTFFAVDEEGTEGSGSRPATSTTRPTPTTGPTGTTATTATGATDVPPNVTPPSRRIVIDRPFLVIVSDRSTGAPLLYGRVVSPRD